MPIAYISTKSISASYKFCKFTLKYQYNMEQKTFKDFGLSFEFDPTCLTCQQGNCHNNVTSKKDGKEYNVHISTNREFSIFNIYATEQMNTDSETTIEETFTDESKAVRFVCENFDWFRCR